MSTLEVNTITPISGSNDVTLGGSSKNIKFASGTTVDFSTNTPTTTLSPTMKMVPAFEASKSADVAVGSGVTLKISANTEKFDIGGCYDNSTNYRFTPNVAGKYYCYGSFAYNVNNAQLRITGELRKNGSSTHASSTLTSANGAGYEDVIGYTGGIVEFNGSSDYLEFFTFHNSGNSRDLRGSSTRTFFGAYKVIGA